MADKEKATFDIPAEEDTGKEETQKMTLEDAEKELSTAELEIAKEHGLISEEKPEEKSEKSEESGEDEDEDTKTEEEDEKKDVEKTSEEDKTEKPEEEEETRDYNANEKALYFKQKRERNKRQKAESERDHEKLKRQHLETKLDGIEARLNNMETGEIDEDDDNERFVTKAELREMRENERKQLTEEQRRQLEQAQEIQERVKGQELDARAKYDDFDNAIELAQKVIKEKEAFAIALKAEVSKEDGNVAELAYEIGKTHPDYGKTKSKPENKTKNKDTVNKIIKNANKKSSSAKLGGGAGRGSRKVTEDELTPEDAVRMSAGQFDKLSRETRERLLKESC